jgi:hypothetical protein
VTHTFLWLILKIEKYNPKRKIRIGIIGGFTGRTSVEYTKHCMRIFRNYLRKKSNRNHQPSTIPPRPKNTTL